MPSTTISALVRKALTRPQRIFPYIQRAWRNHIINRTSANQFEAHRRYIEDYGKDNPNIAMGCETEEQWLQGGLQQIELLLQHGLQPTHRVLDLGCGNLRLGWRLIDYLQAGGYVGTELSPKMLHHARGKITHYKLQRLLLSQIRAQKVSCSAFLTSYLILLLLLYREGARA